MSASLLETLLQPVSLRQFAAEYHGRRPLGVHGSLARLAALRPLDVLASPQSLLASWKDAVSCWLHAPDEDGELVHEVSPALAGRKLEEGHTLYFKQVERFVPQLAGFLRQLELELGQAPGTCRIDAFASPAGQGAPMHFDPGDTYNVQLQGTKRWQLAPNESVAWPVRGYSVMQAASLEASATRAHCHAELPSTMPPDAVRFDDVRPGSLVYVPRGFWHETTATEPSYALAINVRPRCWAQLLSPRVEQALLGSPALRAPAERAHGEPRAALTARVEAHLAALRSVCAALDASSIVDELLRPTRAWRRRPEAEVTVRATSPAARDLTVDVRTGEQTEFELQVPALLAGACRDILRCDGAFSIQLVLTRHPYVTEQDVENLLVALADAGAVAGADDEEVSRCLL